MKKIIKAVLITASLTSAASALVTYEGAWEGTYCDREIKHFLKFWGTPTKYKQDNRFMKNFINITDYDRRAEKIAMIKGNYRSYSRQQRKTKACMIKAYEKATGRELI